MPIFELFLLYNYNYYWSFRNTLFKPLGAFVKWRRKCYKKRKWTEVSVLINISFHSLVKHYGLRSFEPIHRTGGALTQQISCEFHTSFLNLTGCLASQWESTLWRKLYEEKAQKEATVLLGWSWTLNWSFPGTKWNPVWTAHEKGRVLHGKILALSIYCTALHSLIGKALDSNTTHHILFLPPVPINPCFISLAGMDKGKFGLHS